jgi:hypothetical protein
MTQTEFERALVRATGDTRRTIRQHGFTLLEDDGDSTSEPTIAINCPGCGACLDTGSNPMPEFVDCPRCDATYPYSESEVYVAEASHPALQSV